MSTDGRIFITISDKREEGEIPVPKKPKKTEKQLIADYASHNFFNFIESEAKQMVQYTLNNIGNFTGDYNAQREVNFSLSILNFGMQIGTGALVGLKYTGSPWGAAIGAGIVATTQAINFGLQLYSQNLEIRKQNYNISQLKNLSGLDGLTNGSRI